MKISGKAYLDNKGARSAAPSPAAKLTVPSIKTHMGNFNSPE